MDQPPDLGRPKDTLYWSISLKDILCPNQIGIGAILNGVLRSLRPTIVQVPVTDHTPVQLFTRGAYENDHFLEVQLVVKLLFMKFSGIDPILKQDNWALFSLSKYLHLAYFLNDTRNIFRIKSVENQTKKLFNLEKYSPDAVNEQATTIANYAERQISFMYLNNPSETENLKKPGSRLVKSRFNTVRDSVRNLVLEMSKLSEEGDSQLTAHVGVKLCKLLKVDLPDMPAVTAEMQTEENRWKKYFRTQEEKDRLPEMKVAAPTPRLELLDFEVPDIESSKIAENVIGGLEKLTTPKPLRLL